MDGFAFLSLPRKAWGGKAEAKRRPGWGQQVRAPHPDRPPAGPPAPPPPPPRPPPRGGRGGGQQVSAPHPDARLRLASTLPTTRYARGGGIKAPRHSFGRIFSTSASLGR